MILTPLMDPIYGRRRVRRPPWDGIYSRGQGHRHGRVSMDGPFGDKRYWTSTMVLWRELDQPLVRGIGSTLRLAQRGASGRVESRGRHQTGLQPGVGLFQ